MNTTASTRIVGTYVIGLTFCVLVNVATLRADSTSPTGAAGAKSASAADKNAQSAELLKRARQAMAENDLAAAETLVAQADALGVEYNNFYMGDTPKKLHRDLERKRGATASKPSQKFTPSINLRKSAEAPKQDPFAGQPAPSKEDVTPLPKVDVASPRLQTEPSFVADSRYPVTPQSVRDQGVLSSPGKSEAGFSSAGDQGADLLRSARRALAVGDARRASDLAQQAKAKHIQYGPQDDSPEKVLASASRLQEMNAMDHVSEAYRRAYARWLLEQSETLMKYGEFGEAERLAHVAEQQRIAFTPVEAKPSDVLARIAEAKSVPGNKAGLTPPTNPGSDSYAAATSKQQALVLVRQARDAMAVGRFDLADQLARRAEDLHVADSAFSANEDRPTLLSADLRQMRQTNGSGVTPAANYEVIQAGGVGDRNKVASSAVYDSSSDMTRNMQVGANEPTLAPPREAIGADANVIPTPPVAAPDSTQATPMPSATQPTAKTLFDQGEAALRARDKEKAYRLFRQAASRMQELDPTTAQRLQDHLQLLSAPAAGSGLADGASAGSTDAASRQRALVLQTAADLSHQEANAKALREKDPKASLEMLEKAKQKVEAAGLDTASKEQLLRRVDRAIADTKQYAQQNQPALNLAERNENVRKDVDREQKLKLEKQDKLAAMLTEFNKLMEEQRYEEAQVVAKRAIELDPEDPIAQQLDTHSKFVFRYLRNKDVQSRKEDGFIKQLEGVDEASVPFDDRDPYRFPKKWQQLTKSRSKYAEKDRRNVTERELEIQKKLKTPVSVSFNNQPLSKVIDYLAKMTDVNIYLDPKGLSEEGVSTDTPVTLEVRHEIMLKSALNLVLEPLHLSYVVKDEVLKVTSEQMKDGEVYMQTYNVADLVLPIPNFVPVPMGLSAAYQTAMSNVGFPAGSPGFGANNTPLAVVAGHDGKSGAGMVNPNVLAQINSTSRGLTGPNVGQGETRPGPGGLGGGSQADFDSLIDLITATVKPTSWDSVGGPGSIAPFETNLSLVVSQTQEVHEEIAALLEQLRRMQDLQVTIEVRFITLNDNFFERIGVDFDFDIHDYNWGKTTVGFGSMSGTQINTDSRTRDKTAVAGLSAAGDSTSSGVYSSDLDVPFRQNSYGLAVPQFGGYDPSAGAQLGFAILSDIEAYFFVTAAQGDKRTNVLQAPKVTLFNGQQAFVSDTSQSPFVISVIPVVGDFAAAQQPVIVVLSEGTFMTVQAVVSADRRFVRLTVVPFFSKISDVSTFTFTGTTTTTTDTSKEGNQTTPTDATKSSSSSSSSTSGTTVQLPTFAYVTVTTTVSVPDGGTVLLGGIKRLNEGRNEYGVPMLDKVPYLNRLFKNTSVGRETQSLMMMVTPRIIIQEEEEEKLGYTPSEQ